jgi:ribosomal protein S6--L-glutamate ligase
MNLSSEKPQVRYRGGQILDDVEAIIPRIGNSITTYGTAVVRQFEMMGAYTLNSSLSISRSRDKLRSLQILSRKAIRIPVTGFSNSSRDTNDLIKMVGGAPLVVKLVEGTQGIGVVLAETNKAAESVINAFKELKADILVQEFIKESNGEDIRCLVIGDKVVASMKRSSADGDFRANLHRGGVAEKVRITPEERAMAVKSCKSLGLSVAGVDLLRSNKGPMVIEVNSSPGLEGIEKQTGKDIAGLIIKHIEKEYCPKAAIKKKIQA